jgi:hypothetical protein
MTGAANDNHHRPIRRRPRIDARQLSLMLPEMARLDLTDDERDELVCALRQMIDGDRFPLSPRIRRLKAILGKLEPPRAAAEPFPAPRPPSEPRHALRKRRR